MLEYVTLLAGMVLVFYVLGKYFVKLFPKRDGGLEGLRLRSNKLYRWPEIGEYNFEVVGESNYQKALRKHVCEHGDDRADTECTAFIIPEDSNRHDDQAVRVDLQADTVGYLSRDDARSFRRRLNYNKLTGQTTMCNAVIKGGHLRNGERMSYGIWLDIEEFS